MKNRIVMTFESADCNEYNVFRANSRKRLVHIIEYSVDQNIAFPFDNALFEMYNTEDDEFVASAECIKMTRQHFIDRFKMTKRELQHVNLLFVHLNIVEESLTRKVYFNDEFIAKIVKQNNSFELHYIENDRDIGGDICESLSECYDTLIDYYSLDRV